MKKLLLYITITLGMVMTSSASADTDNDILCKEPRPKSWCGPKPGQACFIVMCREKNGKPQWVKINMPRIDDRKPWDNDRRRTSPISCEFLAEPRPQRCRFGSPA